MNIPILYEDKGLLVINKPAGMAVHRDQFTSPDSLTVADWILEKYPELSEVGEDIILNDGVIIKKPGLVHRLDKDTSGALLIAKNQNTYEFLKEQFKNHTVTKTYLALVYGKVKMEGRHELTINYPIGRSRNDPRKRVARVKSVGKMRDALTKIKVKEELGDYTLVEAMPKTGRTHQIRVHLKAINHPVVCDYLYAKGRECPEPLARQALHAAKIEFMLPNPSGSPAGGAPLVVEAGLPEDMALTLEKIRALC